MHDAPSLELLNPEIRTQLGPKAAQEVMEIFLAALDHATIAFRVLLPGIRPGPVRERHVRREDHERVRGDHRHATRACLRPASDLASKGAGSDLLEPLVSAWEADSLSTVAPELKPEAVHPYSVASLLHELPALPPTAPVHGRILRPTSRESRAGSRTRGLYRAIRGPFTGNLAGFSRTPSRSVVFSFAH